MFTHDEAKPGVEIHLDAGGDHQFNLGHLRREGASRLIRLLLQTAGYRRALRWRVRVEKKFGCGPETRPVTVVSSKPWCVYLKIKPGDNNTAHFCSLIMPDGYRGEAVYEDLKEVELRVGAAWRRGFEGEVVPVEEQGQTTRPAAEPPPPLPPEEEVVQAATSLPDAPAEAAEEQEESEAAATSAEPLVAPQAAEKEKAESTAPEPSELWGFSSDPDKVRLALLAIHEVGDEGRARTLDEFVGSLMVKMGWQTLRRKQIGGIFTALVRHGLIQKVIRGSQPVAYALTDEGRQQIEEELPKPRAQAPAPPAPPRHAPAPAPAHAPAPPAVALPLATVQPLGSHLPPPPQTVTALSGLVEHLNHNVKRLTELQARRALLVAELGTIDAELRDLDRHVNNPEVQALISRLIQVTGQNG